MRRLLPILLLGPWLAGCGAGGPERERVLLVTTTTVESSGLLDTLLTAYHASQDRFQVSATAVGSGAALELGRRGDADVLLTHDPIGEQRFMDAGLGSQRGLVMTNQFIIAGPPDDPADVRGATALATALAAIDSTGSLFVSRGDDSGTHRKELELWDRTGRDPPAWSGAYVVAGSGMGETLRIADQRQAYVLTDLGTFRHLSAGLRLEPLVLGSPPEPNPYHYILPRDPLHPEGAHDLVRWLVGPGQAVIADYGAARFGQPLFTPAAR